MPQNLHARRITTVVCGALITVAAIALFAIDPARGDALPGCPFHALTGLYCPGCGSCRALHQLLHGHLGAAVGFNPLMILFLPFLGAKFSFYAVAALRAKPWRDVSLKPVWIQAILGVIIVYGVLRNIHLLPFSWLAP